MRQLGRRLTTIVVLIVVINAALRSDILARSPVLDGGATFCFNFFIFYC